MGTQYWHAPNDGISNVAQLSVGKNAHPALVTAERPQGLKDSSQVLWHTGMTGSVELQGGKPKIQADC